MCSALELQLEPDGPWLSDDRVCEDYGYFREHEQLARVFQQVRPHRVGFRPGDQDDESGQRARGVDGWVAATGRNSTGPFLRVRSSNRLAPGTDAKVGDDICYGKK